MRKFLFAVVGLLAVAAGLVGWRFASPRLHRRISPLVAQTPVGQKVTPQSQIASQQAPSQNTLAQVPTTVPATESVGRPFSIGGRDYTVEVQTSARSVVAMEIRDAAGAVQYRRTFPSPWSLQTSFRTGGLFLPGSSPEPMERDSWSSTMVSRNPQRRRKKSLVGSKYLAC